MKDIILADAHLGSPGDRNYQILLTFLKGLEGQVNTLVLLGDIFEFWSNFNKVPSDYEPLVEQLRELSRTGTQIIWVEGNHDFHLERYFGRIPNFTILPDGGMIHFGNVPLYVAHGDLADLGNTSYLQLRKILRSRIIALMTGILPLALLEWIAARMSRESKKRRRRYNRQNELEPLLEQHAHSWIGQGAMAIITGHYHTPICRTLNGSVMIALGDWINDFSYVEHSDGHFELKTFTG